MIDRVKRWWQRWHGIPDQPTSDERRRDDRRQDEVIARLERVTLFFDVQTERRRREHLER